MKPSPPANLIRLPWQSFTSAMLDWLPPALAMVMLFLGLFELVAGSGKFFGLSLKPDWLSEGTVLFLGQAICLRLMWKLRQESYFGLWESMFVFYLANSVGSFLSPQTSGLVVCLRLAMTGIWAVLVIQMHRQRRHQRSIDSKVENKVFEDNRL